MVDAAADAAVQRPLRAPPAAQVGHGGSDASHLVSEELAQAAAHQQPNDQVRRRVMLVMLYYY